MIVDSCESIEHTVEVCRVCGKRSAGTHYSVPACHGCKSFFRRATLNKTVYPECKFNKLCFLDTPSQQKPRKCRNCRLEKCYKVGMVAMVQVVHQRKPNRESPTDSELPELSLSSRIQTQDNYVLGVIDGLLRLDSQIDKFRSSAYNPFCVPNLETILATTGKLNLADKYGKMQGWPISQKEFIKQQSQINNIKCEENTNLNLTAYGINTKEWLSFDMLAAVEYAKSFPFFQQLESSDKIRLIKATTFMNLSLTSAFTSFMSNMGCLQMPDGVCISGPVGKSEREIRSFERRLSLRVMAPLIRNIFDRNEYVLLKAIILCNSAVTDLSRQAQNHLNQQRHNFTGVLLLYCLTRHGSSNGPARYYSILNMIDVLEHHRRDFCDFMLLLHMSLPSRYSEQRWKFQREILNF